MQVLPFYDDNRILRKRRAFKNYAETYEVETIDNKSLSGLLFLSKSSIKNLLMIYLEKKEGLNTS